MTGQFTAACLKCPLYSVITRNNTKWNGVKGNGGILSDFSVYIHLFAQENYQNNCPDPNLIIVMIWTQGLK